MAVSEPRPKGCQELPEAKPDWKSRKVWASESDWPGLRSRPGYFPAHDPASESVSSQMQIGVGTPPSGGSEEPEVKWAHPYQVPGTGQLMAPTAPAPAVWPYALLYKINKKTARKGFQQQFMTVSWACYFVGLANTIICLRLRMYEKMYGDSLLPVLVPCHPFSLLQSNQCHQSLVNPSRDVF